jgi:hypothetical protein
MARSGHHIKEGLRISEIILISIILASIILLPLGASRIPQEVQTLNVGLPVDAVEKLKDLLKP